MKPSKGERKKHSSIKVQMNREPKRRPERKIYKI
jgi:hypothetical protein